MPYAITDHQGNTPLLKACYTDNINGQMALKQVKEKLLSGTLVIDTAPTKQTTLPVYFSATLPNSSISSFFEPIAFNPAEFLFDLLSTTKKEFTQFLHDCSITNDNFRKRIAKDIIDSTLANKSLLHKMDSQHIFKKYINILSLLSNECLTLKQKAKLPDSQDETPENLLFLLEILEKKPFIASENIKNLIAIRNKTYSDLEEICSTSRTISLYLAKIDSENSIPGTETIQLFIEIKKLNVFIWHKEENSNQLQLYSYNPACDSQLNPIHLLIHQESFTLLANPVAINNTCKNYQITLSKKINSTSDKNAYNHNLLFHALLSMHADTLLPFFFSIGLDRNINDVDISGLNLLHGLILITAKNRISLTEQFAKNNASLYHYFITTLNMLIDAGVDITHPDDCGATPLDYAREYQNRIFSSQDINLARMITDRHQLVNSAQQSNSAAVFRSGAATTYVNPATFFAFGAPAIQTQRQSHYQQTNNLTDHGAG